MVLQPFIAKGISRQKSHKGTVTRLLTSLDSRFLFSGGEDGTLFIYQIEEEKNQENGELLTEKQIRAMAVEQANKVYKLDENESQKSSGLSTRMTVNIANEVLGRHYQSGLNFVLKI